MYESRQRLRVLARLFLGLLGAWGCVASVNAANWTINLTNTFNETVQYRWQYRQTNSSTWITVGTYNLGAHASTSHTSDSDGPYAGGYYWSFQGTGSPPLGTNFALRVSDNADKQYIPQHSTGTGSFYFGNPPTPEFKYDFRIRNGTLNWQNYEIYTNGVLVGRAEIAPGATSAGFTGPCTQTLYPVRVYSPSSVPVFDQSWGDPTGPWISCDGGIQQVLLHSGGGLTTQTTNMIAIQLGLTNQAGNGFERTNNLTEGIFLLVSAQQMGQNVEGDAQTQRAVRETGSNVVQGVLGVSNAIVASTITLSNSLANGNTNRQYFGSLSGFDTSTWGQASQTWSNGVSGLGSYGSATNIGTPEFQPFELVIHGTNKINLDPLAHEWLTPLRTFIRQMIWWVMFMAFFAFAVEKTGTAARDVMKAPQGHAPIVGANALGTGVTSSLLAWPVIGVMLAGALVFGLGAIFAYMADRVDSHAVVSPLADAVAGAYGAPLVNAVAWVDAFVPIAAALFYGFAGIMFEMFLSIATAGVMLIIRMIPACILLCAIQLEASNSVEVWNGRSTNTTLVVDSLQVSLPAGQRILWQDIGVLEMDGTNIPFADGMRNWIMLGESGFRLETDEFALRYFLLGIGASAVWVGLRWALQMMKAGGLPGQYGD